LPLLNAEKANEFITAAAQFMSAHGWTSKKKPNGDAGGAWNTENPGSKRERLYALAALDGCADELAEAPNGERNNTLYKKAFRLGTMVARAWISQSAVFDALFAAADACGLNKDDGEQSSQKTILSGLDDGQKHPHPNLAHDFIEAPVVSNSWKYHIGRKAGPASMAHQGHPAGNRRSSHVRTVGDVQDHRRAGYVRLHHGRTAICWPVSGEAARGGSLSRA
ncbi:MAG: hypothetical protein WCB61_27315, partial [Pseudolabrys sp.]